MDIKTLVGNNLRPDGATAGAKAHGSTKEAVAQERKAEPSSGESVTLTRMAQSLTAARESAGSMPFDAAKVEEIKSAIAEGRYPIDNERLAERMLSYERLLA